MKNRLLRTLPAVTALALSTGCGDDGHHDDRDDRDDHDDLASDASTADSGDDDDAGAEDDAAGAEDTAAADTATPPEDAAASGDTAEPEATSRVIFGDDYGDGVVFADFGGATNALTIDSATWQAGTTSLKVAVPATGYTGGAFTVEPAEDLSGFDAVVFHAKASEAGTINVVGSGNDAVTPTWQVEWGGVAVSTEWQRYVLPLPDASRLDAERGLFHFAEGAEGGVGRDLWFDEIALVKLDAGVVTAPRAAMATQSVTREVGGTVKVEGTSLTVDVDGAAQTLALARGFFSYASSDTAVATVDAAGEVTAVGLGTAEITATFKGAAVNGALTVVVADGNVPATAAPVPVADVNDVISLFSDVYEDVPVDTWSAGWDNADVSDVVIDGDNVKKYSPLVFAGVEFTTATIDASAMTHLHFDLWTPDATEFKVKLVDFGANGSYQGSPNDDSEHELTLNAGTVPAISTGAWLSIDLPLAAFTGLAARANLAQMILVSSNATVYVDNVYFHRVAAPQAPTTAAPTPTHLAADVVSLFSDAYAAHPVSTWSAGWDSADVAEVSVAGNAVKHYTSLVFAGIEFTGATVDASGLTHFHLDLWTPDATSFRVKLVDFGANGVWQGSPNDDSEHELTFDASSSPALSTGGWVSLDIPLSAFGGLTGRGHLAQLIISSSGASVFVDNVYFHK